jgi:hypothetical protein
MAKVMGEALLRRDAACLDQIDGVDGVARAPAPGGKSPTAKTKATAKNKPPMPPSLVLHR